MIQQTTELVCGLDIGSSSIKAVIGKADSLNRLEILGVSQVHANGVQAGQLVNVPALGGSIRNAVDQAADAAGVDVGIVNVGFSTTQVHTFQQNNSFIKDNPEQVFEVEHIYELNRLMYKIKSKAGTEIIHVLPQDYRVDGHLVGTTPLGTMGTRLSADFTIVSLEHQLLRTLRASVKNAGLEVGHLLLEPLASAFSTLQPEEKQDGVALIDIGAHYTSIIVFHHGGVRFVDVIPFGGYHITGDLMEGFGIRRKEANTLKEQFGCALTEEADPEVVVSIPWHRKNDEKHVSVSNVAKVIEACLEELVKEIHARLIYSGWEEKLRSGLVITGGSSKLREIDSLFEYVTGHETRIGNPHEYVADSSLSIAKEPELSCAIGLAMADLLSVEERRFLSPMANMHPELRQTRPGPKGGKGKGWFSKPLDIFRNLLDDEDDEYLKKY